MSVFSESRGVRDKKSLNETGGAIRFDEGAESGESSPERVSTLAHGMLITGNIVCDGSVNVFGRVIGDIDASQLVIAEGAQVEGNVIAQELTIHGVFKGTIDGDAVKRQSDEAYNKSLISKRNARFKGMLRRIEVKLCYLAFICFVGGVISVAYIGNLSDDNTFDRIQAGRWVVASMYWEDKLVSTGKKFDPIGLHAAHKTLPIGTLIRVSNPKNHRSINVTINDRGPYIAGRELDLTLGAGALLGFQGLGIVYLEVLSIPPIKNNQRPAVENIFSVNPPR